MFVVPTERDRFICLLLQIRRPALDLNGNKSPMALTCVISNLYFAINTDVARGLLSEHPPKLLRNREGDHGYTDAPLLILFRKRWYIARHPFPFCAYSLEQRCRDNI